MTFIGQFVFVSSQGRLLQAYATGELQASRSVENVGEEEQWNVYVWPDGKISLQNCHTKRWLCAENTGRAICDRPGPAVWEQWTLYAIGDGVHVAFKSYHGKWLCAHEPGHDTQYGGEVIADRVNCGECEHFTMIPAPGIQLENQSWSNDALNVVRAAATIVPIVLGAGG
jgi:hypothetical protein